METAVSFVHTAQYRAHQFNKGQGVVLLADNKWLLSDAPTQALRYSAKPWCYVDSPCGHQWQHEICLDNAR